MKRRTLLAVLFAAAAWPALADDDDDDGGSDDDGGDDDGGDDDDDGGVDDHNDARHAVETRGVLELEDLLARFRQQVQGRVVDITLLDRSNGLVFRVTYVDPAGRVRRAQLDARTGALLR
jgi:uncharacterized membrane protein YkoI